MADIGKVAVLFGGRSAEREISLKSGSMVLAALNRRGIDAYAFDPAERPLQDLVDRGFERAFIALHGRYGEDGTVQGALEMLGVPYTGSGVLASALAIDKVATKRIWASLGLPTPAFEVCLPASRGTQLVQQLGLPYIVKPAREGSTLGLTKVTRAAGHRAAYRLASSFDVDVLAESFVDGRELTVSVLGEGAQAKALPAIEIRAPEGNYDYRNKYFTDDTRYLCPAPIDAALSREIAALSVAAYRALGCAGWGRVDLMLDRDMKPWLLEVNTSPGMTDHSLVPMAAKAVGIDYDALVEQVLRSACLKTAARGKGQP
ncbi:MAG: D-alanine--D-alanine ligase [Burkholderiaceae bacterium]|nr:D-alanine--D-alanine ligase [Burkholderiaceae bacterium]